MKNRTSKLPFCEELRSPIRLRRQPVSLYRSFINFFKGTISNSLNGSDQVEYIDAERARKLGLLKSHYSINNDHDLAMCLAIEFIDGFKVEDNTSAPSINKKGRPLDWSHEKAAEFVYAIDQIKEKQNLSSISAACEALRADPEWRDTLKMTGTPSLNNRYSSAKRDPQVGAYLRLIKKWGKSTGPYEPFITS